jgi:hypothetical protein
MGLVLLLACDRGMLLAVLLLIFLWAVLINLGSVALEWLL